MLKVYFDADPDRAFIDRYLATVRRWAEREGVPPRHVLMGEFGALRTDRRYVAAPAADRIRYIADVRRSAEATDFRGPSGTSSTEWASWTMPRVGSTGMWSKRSG